MGHELRTFSDLAWDGWFVLACVFASFVIMIADWVSPPLTMLAEVAIFMGVGVLTAREALRGFSSTGVWIVAVMLVVAQGLAGTGGLDYLMSKALGRPADVTIAQFRIMFATSILGSFISGTPVTAMMIPITIAFAQKARLPIKQLLQPMVFSSQTAGTNTILGTSSNLAIIGMMEMHWADPNSASFRPDFKVPGVFSLTPYGIPGCFFGIAFCLILAPMFLTQGEGFRKWINYFCLGEVGSVWRKTRSIDVTLIVPQDSVLVDMSVDESGLIDYGTIAPIALYRTNGDEELGVGESGMVHKDIFLQAGDRIVFAGELAKIPELMLRYNFQVLDDDMGQALALEISGDDMTGGMDASHKSEAWRDHSVSAIVNYGPPRMFTGIISGDSHFLGHTVSSLNLATNFKLSIVAVERGGVQLEGPVPDIMLNAGDKVLMSVEPTFWKKDVDVTNELDDIQKVLGTGFINEYVVGMEVRGQLAKPLLQGLTVAAVGLKALTDGFLIGLQRGSDFFNAVDDEEVLQLGDILWIAGTPKCIAFARKTPGLEPLARESKYLGKDHLLDRHLIEATISEKSPIIGKTAEDCNFTTIHQASILGIRRQGTRVIGYPTTIVFKAGDVLLLEGGDLTLAAAKDSPVFTTMLPVPDSTPPKLLWVLIALAIYIPCFIAFAVFSWRPVFVMMAICVMFMMCTRCVSPRQAWKAVKWDIIMCIGASLAISEAMELTGAAEAIASLLLSIGGTNPGILVALMYLTTSILSLLVMDTAAATMVFPVAASIADAADIDIYSMSFAIMIGANACYLFFFANTSIIMTFGAGQYTAPQWIRYSLPFQILMNIVTCFTMYLSQAGKLFVVWIYSGIFCFAVLVIPHMYLFVSWKRDRAIRQRRELARQARLEKLEGHGNHDSDSNFYALEGGKTAAGYRKLGQDDE